MRGHGGRWCAVWEVHAGPHRLHDVCGRAGAEPGAHGVCGVRGGDGGDARCVRPVLVWPAAERGEHRVHQLQRPELVRPRRARLGERGGPGVRRVRRWSGAVCQQRGVRRVPTGSVQRRRCVVWVLSCGAGAERDGVQRRGDALLGVHQRDAPAQRRPPGARCHGVVRELLARAAGERGSRRLRGVPGRHVQLRRWRLHCVQCGGRAECREGGVCGVRGDVQWGRPRVPGLFGRRAAEPAVPRHVVRRVQRAGGQRQPVQWGRRGVCGVWCGERGGHRAWCVHAVWLRAVQLRRQRVRCVRGWVAATRPGGRHGSSYRRRRRWLRQVCAGGRGDDQCGWGQV